MVVGMFVVTWVAAVMIWKRRNIEQRWERNLVAEDLDHRAPRRWIVDGLPESVLDGPRARQWRVDHRRVVGHWVDCQWVDRLPDGSE